MIADNRMRYALNRAWLPNDETAWT